VQTSTWSGARVRADTSDTLPVMKMKIGLPLSKAEFTPAVQALVREAIAAAVGVDARRVRILSVVEAARRRLLAYSLTLEIAIEMPPGESRLDTMTANSTMTANNLNRELVARNLPQATMLEPPIIVLRRMKMQLPAFLGPLSTISMTSQ
jgi:hypothetical protein